MQKRDTGRMFAMKYVSRSSCDSRDTLYGVLREVELLSTLEHPFLVNLWFSFQGTNARDNTIIYVCGIILLFAQL